MTVLTVLYLAHCLGVASRNTNCLLESTSGLNTLEADQVIKEWDRKYWSDRQTDGLPGNNYFE